MSLVSAVIGQTRGDELASDAQKKFNDVAEQLNDLTKFGQEIGSQLARFDSYIDRLQNQKSQLMGQQNALAQNSIFNNNKSNNGQNILAYSNNIQGQFNDVLQQIVRAKIQKNQLKAKQEMIHEQEKVLKRKKNHLDLMVKMGEGQSKKNEKFIDSQIKSFFG